MGKINRGLALSLSKGFTLIELLMTIAIIAVISAIVATAGPSYMKRSRDAKRKADLEQIRSAVEMCRADSGTYPTGSLVSGGGPIACGSSTYMAVIPSDPLTGRQYVYTPTVVSGVANAYTLCAALEIETVAVSGCGVGCGGTTSCTSKLTQP